MAGANRKVGLEFVWRLTYKWAFSSLSKQVLTVMLFKEFSIQASALKASGVTASTEEHVSYTCPDGKQAHISPNPGVLFFFFFESLMISKIFQTLLRSETQYF